MRLAVSDDRLGLAEPFTTAVHVPLPDAPFGTRLALLARHATEAGCEWLFHLRPGERPAAAAVARAALALSRYDAVFGALETGTPPTLWHPSRLAFDAPDRLPHALLHWWVGQTLFTRTQAIAELAADGSLEGADEPDTLFMLWRGVPAIKLAQPLSGRAEPPPPMGEARRDAILKRLSDAPARTIVRYGERSYALPYSGRNAGIEREQTRGLFFEQEELVHLAAHLGPGRVVADIGANTGNHTVFFAGPMRCARVLPFEPMPDAAALLKLAVDWNALDNVELGHLHHGIGAGRARMRAVHSSRGGLGATRLVADEEGDISILPLDEALTGHVDLLKIDVEAMELDVLAGAAGVIARCRPSIFIEIAEASAAAFRHWLSANGYRVERVFSDKGHTNLLVAPADG